MPPLEKSLLGTAGFYFVHHSITCIVYTYLYNNNSMGIITRVTLDLHF